MLIHSLGDHVRFQMRGYSSGAVGDDICQFQFVFLRNASYLIALRLHRCKLPLILFAFVKRSGQVQQRPWPLVQR